MYMHYCNLCMGQYDRVLQAPQVRLEDDVQET